MLYYFCGVCFSVATIHVSSSEKQDRFLTGRRVFFLQETNEIVAIKKFKDSEGKRVPVSNEKSSSEHTCDFNGHPLCSCWLHPKLIITQQLTVIMIFPL